MDKARFYEPTSALYRLKQEAPFLARCSDNKTATLVRPRDYAIRYPYMQVNRPGMVSWLIFDLDHTNAFIWEDKGLPTPNLIVTNRENGHSHLYYAINPVCTTENARSKPIRFMKAIYEAYASVLEADPSYSGPVAKTPGHPWWITSELHGRVLELGELADYVELPMQSPWSKGPNFDAVAHSRHCLLFEDLRFYAYSIRNREREQGSFIAFTRLLEAYAFNHNNFKNRGFSESLSLSQVMATVKSVARWTWDRYSGGSRCNQGVMRLDKSLSIEERQSLSAKRTHEVRSKATESKIRAAYHKLIDSDSKITYVAIADISGLSRQTVSKYKSVIDELSQCHQGTSNVVSLGESALKLKCVNYGTHQITAGFIDGEDCKAVVSNDRELKKPPD